MPGFAADLPDTAVGLAPVFQRVLHLPAGQIPDPLVEPVTRLGVEVYRVQHHSPDIVLSLLVGGVAGAHRPGRARPPAVGCGDDMPIRLQREPQRLQNQRVVVDDEDAQRRHRSRRR